MSANASTLESPVAKAQLFYKELVDSVEALTAIGEIHGAQTLADVIHLQGAILGDGYIDAWPSSKILDVLRALPSSSVWLDYASVYSDEGECLQTSKYCRDAYTPKDAPGA